MEEYLIEVPPGEDINSFKRAIQICLRSGSHFVTYAIWGCMDGDHKAWAIDTVEIKDASP